MKNILPIIVIIVAVMALIMVVFLWPADDGETSQDNRSEKINVIVSILPQKDFVKAIGGDYVTVKELIPPGSSPATYELKPQDLIAIEEADIYFRIGYIPFEKANIENIKEANPSLNIVDTSENVNLRYFGEHEEHSHDEDHDAHEDDTDHDDEHAEIPKVDIL
jgi:zinc transport system substrate-binding protein